MKVKPEEVSAETQLELAALVALDCLNNLTTEEFSRGGDRLARESLVLALNRLGLLGDEVAYEYKRG